MTIAYRSHSSAFGNPTCSIARPSGLQNGDVLIAIIWTSDSAGGSRLSGFPYGIASARTHYGGFHGYGWWGEVLFRQVTNAAAEPSSYGLESLNNYPCGGVLIAYSGVADGSQSPVGWPMWNNPNSTQQYQHMPPDGWYGAEWNSDGLASSTMRVGDHHVGPGSLSVVGLWTEGATTFNAPSGWSLRTQVQLGNWATIGVLEKAHSLQGYTGTVTWSLPTSMYPGSGHTVLAGGNQNPSCSLTSPAAGAVLDRFTTQRFQWAFSDPDPSDGPWSYTFEYRVAGSGQQYTQVSANMGVTRTYHDFAPGTFGQADYEWRVRVFDKNGGYSPFTAWRPFSTIDPPDGPTIIDPPNGGVVGDEHLVVWSSPDQDSYQLRTVADSAGSPVTGTVYHDTGEVVEADTRERLVPFPVSGRAEHVQVREKVDGLWSEWSSVRVTVAHTPPSAPLVWFEDQPDAGAVDVNIVNLDPTGDEPTVSYNEIWVDDGLGDGLLRKVERQAPNSTWRYWTPVSGRTYDSSNVKVRAVSDTGSSTWSA